MAPSGSQARASSPAMISPTAPAHYANHAARSEFHFTSFSLFHACVAATAFCAVIWAAIGFILVG